MLTASETIVGLLDRLRFYEGQVLGQFPGDQPGELAWKPLAYPLPLRLDGSTPEAPLTDPETALLLTEYLYQNFYVFGRTSVARPGPGGEYINDSRAEFEATTLRATKVGESRHGWTRVRHRSTHILAPAGLYLVDGRNVDLRVSSSEPEELDQQARQFVWGRVKSILPRLGSTVRYVRFYLHFELRLGSGTALARTIKTILDDRGIPFSLKYLIAQGETLPDPLRQDTAILYVSADDFVPVFFALREIYPALSLTAGATLFVRSFGGMPGLSFAEDPVGGESFGKARMKLIAEAVLNTMKAPDGTRPDGTVNPEPVLTWISDRGYPLGAFHLEPTSTFPYNEALFALDPTPPALRMEASVGVQKARQVGDWLCRDALWITAKRCDWLGASSDEQPISYSFLDESWQSGRLGIAVFLHILARYTRCPLYGYVAEGAVPNLEKAIENPANAPIRNALIRLVDYCPHVSVSAKLDAAESFTRKPSLPTVPLYEVAKDAFRAIRVALQKENELPLIEEAYREQLFQDPYVALAFEANEWGIDEFVPGLNGLALVGFGFLRMADPNLPPIPLRPERE